MARHQFTKDEQSRGGQKGYEVTMERHPWMYQYLKYAPGMKKHKPGKFNPQKQESNNT